MSVWPPTWMRRALFWPTLRTSLATAAVVGPILIAINQGDRLLAGDGPNVGKAVLTTVVPALVLMYGAAMAELRQQQSTRYQDGHASSVQRNPNANQRS